MYVLFCAVKMHENFLKKGSCWRVVVIPLLFGLAFTNVFKFYNVVMARNKNHVYNYLLKISGFWELYRALHFSMKKKWSSGGKVQLIHWHGRVIKIQKTIDIFRFNVHAFLYKQFSLTCLHKTVILT